MEKKSKVRRRRKNPDDEAEATPEEGNPSEMLEEPEITIDVCEDWLTEAHTISRNIIARYNEGLTPLELDAIGNGIKCIELVLRDDAMMSLYQNDAIEAMQRQKEEAQKQRR